MVDEAFFPAGAVPHEAEALRQIGRVSLAEQVHDELARGLSTGRFLPGTRLVVRDLAEVMGLSPTPVREALQQLVAEGALTQEAGRSFRVPEFTGSDYEELRSLRVMLEGEAAASAALRIGDEAIARLASIHEQLIAAKAAEDYKAAIFWNQAFHLGVSAESGNRRLLRLVNGLWLQMGPLLNMLYLRTGSDRQQDSDLAPEARHAHEVLLDAFRNRDPEAARAALQGDINGGSAEILDAIAKRRKSAKRTRS